MSDPAPPPEPSDPTEVFRQHRDVLMAVAYRILGRFADAEDVVQEAWLRWTRADPAEVTNPRAFLLRTAARLALDRLRRIKARRETYVGPWLPEPIQTEQQVTERVELAESVSLALLVVLETLSPLERAVFVLREAFGLSFAEIAEIVGRSEAAVRQLAHRARAHVRARRPRFQADPATYRRVTERFLATSLTGDLDGLMAVLAPGVTLVADGGGQTRAPLRPVQGADRVARFMVAVARGRGPEVRAELVEINGGPGIVVSDAGAPTAALVLDVTDGLVQTVYLVANPGKLGGLRAGAET